MQTFRSAKRKVKLTTVPIGLIMPSPFQPRRSFDVAELENLADSIRKNGLLQPIAVRRLDDGCYELIAGERRLRAARIAGLAEIPCVVHTADDRRSALLGLIENMQRQDLSPFEEAEGILRMMREWDMTQSEAAARLGKAQSTVANKLRLLKLSPAERERIVSARLTERHARVLLKIDDEGLRVEALDHIIANGLGVADAECYIDGLLRKEDERKPAVRLHIIKDYRIYINTLSKAVDTLRRSGLDARCDQVENDDFIKYTVIIPKGGQQLPLFK